MFGINGPKLLIIAAVALIVIGPKDLPDTLRKVGRTIAYLRRMAGQFRSQFDDILRVAELDEVRKEIQSTHEDLWSPTRSQVQTPPPVRPPPVKNGREAAEKAVAVAAETSSQSAAAPKQPG